QLKHLYADSHVDNFDEYTPVLRRDYWRIVAPYVAQKKPRSALEIGCSSGFFLEELVANGVPNVQGVEPSLQAIEKAAPTVKKGIRSGFFEGLKTFPKERFDLVTSFHVLDHVDDPRGFVQGCFDVLNPGGLVCLVAHDVNSLQAKIL